MLRGESKCWFFRLEMHSIKHGDDLPLLVSKKVLHLKEEKCLSQEFAPEYYSSQLPRMIIMVLKFCRIRFWIRKKKKKRYRKFKDIGSGDLLYDGDPSPSRARRWFRDTYKLAGRANLGQVGGLTRLQSTPMERTGDVLEGQVTED